MGRGCLLVLAVLCGCSKIDRPDGWARETHGKVDPAYGVVLDPNVVHTIKITIAPADYEAMNADLAALTAGGIGGPGGGGMFPPPGGDGDFPPPPGSDGGTFLPPDGGMFLPPDGGMRPMMGPGGGMGANLIASDPIYVPVQVQMDGHTWWNVGMRYKGNSSLASSAQSGNRKVPFRLDFDRFEDRFPEIDDQRFYGFAKMTFASNFGDASQIREALVSELFRDTGLHVARWAFYRVVVDVGNGEEYLGLYTAIEDPSDAMMDREFGDGEGNLYKPEGVGADWTVFNADGFVKKTNEEAADYSDVERAIAALHADRSDAAAWRAGLEATFDPGIFLRWLAANTAVANWDAYGSMAHNYYLYGDLGSNGRLVWIPWDHNLALGANIGGPGGMGGPPGGGMFPGGMSTTDPAGILRTGEDGTRWPLIGYLLRDPEYASIYRAELQAFLDGPFAEQPVADRIVALHDLVEADAISEVEGSRTTTPESFAASFAEGETSLVGRIEAQRTAVREALSPPEPAP